MYAVDLSALYVFFLFFFFNDPATTEIYTLSLHDALPISQRRHPRGRLRASARLREARDAGQGVARGARATSHRSVEHTSELQSLAYLVCRLLLEKKNTTVIRASTGQLWSPADYLNSGSLH